MGLFSGMFNGKANQREFTKEMLPKNRFELFWEMLKLNFVNLIKLNFAYFLLSIPFWIWTALQYIMLMNQINATAQPDLAVILTDYLTKGTFTVYLLGLIPCVAIQQFGKPGLKYVTRNWARDDHAYFWSDFWDAVKQNWKQSLPMSLLNGALAFLAPFGVLFYTLESGTSPIYSFLQIFLLVLSAVYLMANLYIWPMMVTYEMSLSTAIRNSFVIAVGRLPFSLAYLLLTLLPIVISLWFPPFAVYYMLIGYALNAFINVSYTNGVFDKVLNARIDGAQTNKGLRPNEEDEYEYVDIDEDEEETDPDDIDADDEPTGGKKK